MLRKKRILILGDTFLERFTPWLKEFHNEIHVIASHNTESLSLVDQFLIDPVISTEEIKSYIQKNQIEGIISKVDTNNEFHLIRDAVIKEYADEHSIPFFGQSMRSAIISMDKSIQRIIFESEAIPMPKGYIVNDEKDLLQASSKLRFPVVLKKNTGSANVGVFFAKNTEELELIYASNKMNNMVLEEFIAGQEVGLQAIVVGGNIRIIQHAYLGQTSIQSDPHSRYRISPGLDPRLKKEAERLIEHLVKITGVNGILQVDCIHEPDSNRLLVLEVNNRFNGMCDLVSYSSGFNVFKNTVLYSMGIKDFDRENQAIAVEIPIKSLHAKEWGVDSFVKASREFKNIIFVLLVADTIEDLIKATRRIPEEQKNYDQIEFEKKLKELVN